MITKAFRQHLRDILQHYDEYLFVIVVTVLTLAIMIFEPMTSDLLRYQANQVNEGEWWRILTANLCHSNWNHWALNITGLWLMEFFYQPVIHARLRAYLLIFCMLLNVMMLHLWLDIGWYVGLSGALHGYLIGGALLSWRKAPILNSSIILVTVLKLFIESFWQINSATEQLIGANVLEESHSFGALSSVIFFILWWLFTKIKRPLDN